MMFKLADLCPQTRAFQFTVEEIHRLCSAYKYLIEKHPEIANYNYRSSSKVLPKSQTICVKVAEHTDEMNPTSPVAIAAKS